MRLHLGRNSRTVVGDLDHDAAIFTIRAHAKLALAFHRIDSVVDDIGPHLVQLATEGIYQQRHWFVLALYHDSLLELVIQNGKRVLEALHHVHVLDRSLVHVRVLLDRTYQVGNSRRAAFNFI